MFYFFWYQNSIKKTLFTPKITFFDLLLKWKKWKSKILGTIIFNSLNKTQNKPLLKKCRRCGLFLCWFMAADYVMQVLNACFLLFELRHNYGKLRYFVFEVRGWMLLKRFKNNVFSGFLVAGAKYTLLNKNTLKTGLYFSFCFAVCYLWFVLNVGIF